MNTQEFLNEIYKGCEDGYLTLTLLPARKTLWFPIKALEKAAMEAEKYGKNTNTFFGVYILK